MKDINDKTQRSGESKARLVPTIGIYSVVAFISILTIGLVGIQSLSNIATMATDTRDTVLPAILERQRTALNLERMGRFAEIVYRSTDREVRRKYTLAARVLSQDAIFETNKTITRQVIDGYHDIKLIADIRNRQERLTKSNDGILHLFLPGSVNANRLLRIPGGDALISLLFKADTATSQTDLLDLEKRFILQSRKMPADVTGIVKQGRTLFAQTIQRLRMENECATRWQRVNTSLEQLSDNITLNAASVADDRFVAIAGEADKAMRNGYLAAAALMLSLFILLFFAHRDIVVPILKYVQGLNKIGKGERDITFPPARLKELNDIRQAVNNSALLMTQLAARTNELEKANQNLEKEIEVRRKAQKELAQAKEQAESADRAKSEFLAGMSHEIRTPMNTMLGMGELILETDPTPIQRSYIEVLQSSGEMLLAIINDVLDLSKVEAGQVELEIVPIDLELFLSRTREIVMERARQKGLDFVIDVRDGVPEHFYGDPARLRQVLVNLIDNGVKFTETGEVRLSIRRADATTPSQLIFAVSDTGIGIPEEAQDRIFNQFTQADTSTTRKYGGTGLGLSICRRLVELMGGTISVSSSPGQGATFQFSASFPVVRKPEVAPSTPHQKNEAQEALLQNTPYSILVAEDSDSNQALIELYFKQTACKLDFAADGQEAVTMYSSGEYDLILMDIQMPVMDGHEAARRIREFEKDNNRPQRPIIAVTANAFKEDRETSLAAGCTDYLAKPISKSALLQCVASHVAQKN